MHRGRGAATPLVSRLLRWLALGCPALLAGLLLAPGPATATAVPAVAGWVWPLDPAPAVVARFDAPTGPFAAGHRGVDLAATVGQQVLAAGRGTVAFAGTVAGKPVVSIDHAGGLRTTYEPVLADVRAGDRVVPGSPVGRVAGTPGHCAPVTCLHWGLRVGPGLATYQDPLSLLGLLPVRLLPVWGTAQLAAETVPPATGPAPRRGTRSPPATPDRGPLMAGSR